MSDLRMRIYIQDARDIPLERLDREHTQVAVQVWRVQGRALHNDAKYTPGRYYGDLLGYTPTALQSALALAWVHNPVIGHPMFGDLHIFGRGVPARKHAAIWTEGASESAVEVVTELRYRVQYRCHTQVDTPTTDILYQQRLFEFTERAR